MSIAGMHGIPAFLTCRVTGDIDKKMKKYNNFGCISKENYVN